jgi:hypothetical protein
MTFKDPAAKLSRRRLLAMGGTAALAPVALRFPHLRHPQPPHHGGWDQPSPGWGQSPSPLATSDQQILDRQALELWQEGDFSVALATARAAFLTGHGPADAEALSRLENGVAELGFGMVQTAINGDAYRPRVYWVATTPHRWFGLNVPGSRWAFDNPDTVYRTIPIDPSQQYVIRGTLQGTGVIDQAFSLVSDVLTQAPVGYVDGVPLRSRWLPNYTVTIGPDPANGRTNHIQTTPNAVQLFIRSTIGDWSHEIPDRLTVQRVPNGSEPPAPSRAALIAEVNQLITGGATDFGVGLLGYKVMLPAVNTFPAPTAAAGGLQTQYNTFGHFSLRPDQGLLVSVDPAGAGYISTPVTDPWMVGVDPRGHQTSFNSSQAHRNADGIYTFVISATDPGILNWLDTVGRTEGTVMARWQRLPNPLTATPAIQTQVVELSSLSRYLPRGMPRVSPGERRRQLAQRASDYDQRFAD